MCIVHTEGFQKKVMEGESGLKGKKIKVKSTLKALPVIWDPFLKGLILSSLGGTGKLLGIGCSDYASSQVEGRGKEKKYQILTFTANQCLFL